MQRNVVTSATSVKLLLEGGCGFGCSLSDEGGMLLKFSLPRGATSKQLYFRLPRNVNACPKYWNEASRCHTLPNTPFGRSGLAAGSFFRQSSRWNLGCLTGI